jgi:dTDP-4-amino-4,6-dideoxygalactose transaminase
VHGVEPLTDRTSATYLATVLADDRDALLTALGTQGIGAGVHFRRNDHHPMFGGVRDLPGAEAYWTRTVSLPVHLALSDAEVDEVIEVICTSARPG